MPPRDTCIGILSKAICKIEKKQFHGSINKVVTSLFRYISPEMPFIFKILFANLWLTAPLIKLILASKNSTNALIRTTIAPTMLKAGIKDNILPNEASAVINLRVIPGEDNDSVLKHIKKALGTLPIRFKVLEHAKFNPSSISRLNNYSFKLIQLAIVITSYSIHYTKLYELLVQFLLTIRGSKKTAKQVGRCFLMLAILSRALTT